MSDITLSTAVRNNLLSLQNTASLLGKTQERLATGLKVNSALDDPTAFFTASSLNSRAGDLNRLLDSLSNGIQTIEAADNGLTAITTTVESLQATVNQARQDASFKSSSFTIDSATIGTATAKTLSFTGGEVGATAVNVALNTADTAAVQSSVTASADYVAPTAAVQSTVAASADYVAPTAATAGTESFSFAGNPITFTDAADTISFNITIDGVGPTAVTLTQAQVAAAGNTDNTIDDAAEFEEVLNAALTAAGIAGGVTVSRSVNDFTITSNSTGATSAVAITGPAVNDANANDASITVANTGLDSLTTVAGAAAVDRAITISDGTNTANITLTSANAGDAATARTYIAGQLTAQSVAGITVGGAGNEIDLTGLADGSNSITVGGADVDDVFGAGAVTTAGAEAADRVITVSNGTTTANITLTSANAADAATARTYITGQLTAQSVSGVTVGGAGNRIDLTGAADGSNDLTVGGANVADVFGGAPTTVAGDVAVGGSVRTVDQLVTSINADANLTGKVRASNENGSLRIENLSLEALTTTGVTSGAVTGAAGTAEIGGNEVRRDLVNQFNLLRNELNKLADDASFNGINLLRGDLLKLNFNENGSSNVSIQAKDSTGAVRAINASNLSIGAADNTEFGSNSTLDSRREGLANALNTLRTQASQFGSNLSIVQNRQEFTKNIINTLQTGAANLTLADTNEEGANLLALQTRQQLSSVALSLASQADQNVLRLF